MSRIIGSADGKIVLVYGEIVKVFLDGIAFFGPYGDKALMLEMEHYLSFSGLWFSSHIKEALSECG